MWLRIVSSHCVSVARPPEQAVKPRRFKHLFENKWTTAIRLSLFGKPAAVRTAGIYPNVSNLPDRPGQCGVVAAVDIRLAVVVVLTVLPAPVLVVTVVAAVSAVDTVVVAVVGKRLGFPHICR